MNLPVGPDFLNIGMHVDNFASSKTLSEGLSFWGKHTIRTRHAFVNRKLRVLAQLEEKFTFPWALAIEDKKEPKDNSEGILPNRKKIGWSEIITRELQKSLGQQT